MKIYKAKTEWKDSFPELLTMWEEKGWCEIIKTNEPCTWALEEGKVLLYEHDRLSQLPVNWEYGLFANEVLNQENCTPWIYWLRHPRKLEASIESCILNWGQRDIESIFLGKVENPI